MTTSPQSEQEASDFFMEEFFNSLPDRVARETRFASGTARAVYLIAKRIVFKGTEPSVNQVMRKFDFSREKAQFILEHTRVLIRRELVALEAQDISHFAWNGRFCDLFNPKK